MIPQLKAFLAKRNGEETAKRIDFKMEDKTDTGVLFTTLIPSLIDLTEDEYSEFF